MSLGSIFLISPTLFLCSIVFIAMMCSKEKQIMKLMAWMELLSVHLKWIQFRPRKVTDADIWIFQNSCMPLKLTCIFSRCKAV